MPVGAFRRSGVLVDGQRIVDHSDVLWIQTPTWYADFRHRIDATHPVDERQPAWTYEDHAFGGTASWDGEAITWQHAFDSTPDGSVDRGYLRQSGSLLLEGGLTIRDGIEVSFIEEWSLLTEATDRYKVLHTESQLRVEYGDHCIEVTLDENGIAAKRFLRSSLGEWSLTGEIRK